MSTANPGNGGPLRQPRGQTGIFYKYALLVLQALCLVFAGSPVGRRQAAEQEQVFFCHAMYVLTSPLWLLEVQAS